MKMVTLTRDMRPWRQGDRVPLADAVADRLVLNNEATNPEPWGAAEPAAPVYDVAATPERPAAAAGFATRRGLRR